MVPKHVFFVVMAIAVGPLTFAGRGVAFGGWRCLAQK